MFITAITIDKTAFVFYYLKGDYMLTKFKNIRAFYRTWGTNTRLVIRITLITVVCTLLASVYAYTATFSPNHFDLLRISDDLLEMAKSVAGIGFIGTLVVGYGERKEKMNIE